MRGWVSAEIRADPPVANARTCSSDGHRRVAGERGQQRAMRPAEADRLLGRRAAQQPVEEPRREAVAAADAIEDVELAGRRHVGLPADPGDRAPA